MEFTKEKWEVDKSGYKTANGGTCIMNDHECIAVVGDGNPYQPIDANALLISKAPEMLEMLKWFVDNFEGVFHENTETNNKLEEAKQLIKESTEIN